MGSASSFFFVAQISRPARKGSQSFAQKCTVFLREIFSSFHANVVHASTLIRYRGMPFLYFCSALLSVLASLSL